MTNSLLEKHEFPAFDRINTADIVPAIEQIIANNRQELDSVLQRAHPARWDNLMAPLEDLQDRLQQAWSPVVHLYNTMNSEPLRQAYNSCLTQLSAYQTELKQHESLYLAIAKLKESPEFSKLNSAQKKVIDNELRDFLLSGVTLDKAKQQRFAALQQDISRLTTTFSEHVLDATHHFSLTVTHQDELAGIPLHAVAHARERALTQKQEGWIFTLEQPDYLAIMQYAQSRSLRRQMYESYVTRASDLGPTAGQFDNTLVMFDLLATRQQLADVMGFRDFTELSFITKMAKNTAEVTEFLHKLLKKAQPLAVKELAELADFAEKTDGISTLAPWDIAYYSERLSQKKFSISQEELRPYFPEDKVLSGMFKLAEKLFDIHIRRKNDVPVWHPDARCFVVKNSQQEPIAYFYLDNYARNQKRDGAWMDECRIRRKLSDGSIQLPIAYLTCNFAKPANGKPALLTHDDVVTLFHEFGHGLHHMLTTVDYAGVSGINGVAWDTVELPSQFFENWCWQQPVLEWISSHVDTGEVLPELFLNKLREAKNFQSGLHMLRQVEFALFDLRIHSEFNPSEGPRQIQRILDEVRAQVSVVPVASCNRFQHSFSHIFAGGYAAGYYSYKWAEVLSSDAFAAFEECGIFDRQTSQKFLQCILQKGGAEDMEKLFFDFRGRTASIDALLKHSGLAIHD